MTLCLLQYVLLDEVEKSYGVIFSRNVFSVIVFFQLILQDLTTLSEG